MNNKPFGLNIASVVSASLLALGLSACGSSPKQVQQPAPVVSEPPPVVAAEPEPVVQEAAPTKPVAMAHAYPDRYTVVKGDTLWDISKRFLKDPWLWPEVWHINPGIRNPHLIYPGDIIVLYFVDGKPYLTLDGQGGVIPAKPEQVAKVPVPKGLRTEKRSPQARESSLNRAIDTIPASAIGPFLIRPRVVTENELDRAPYIVSSYEGHLISGSGNRIYARNMDPKSDVGMFNVIRKGQEYEDPETGRTLGYEAIYLADAHLIKQGNPATLSVTKAVREVLNNDVLLPIDQTPPMYHYMPHAPEKEMTGQIMSVFNGLSQIGQYNVVVLNRGERDSMEVGHVLAVYQKGAIVKDTQRFFSSNVKLPDERAGLVMVFRVFEKVSYALVMEANRPLHVNDFVTNPNR